MRLRSTVRAWANRHDRGLFVGFAIVILLFLGASLTVMATDEHPMSFLDEHVHYDTALKIQEGELSYRGALYEREVVDEWACGVGHQAGGLVHGCHDPQLNVRDVTSGQYTTGYIHYPTYFYLAEAFRGVVEAISGPHLDLSEYRLFSALMMWLGAVACAVFAYLLGIRRWGLIAATTLPSAATSILVMGTMVTPNSTSLLAGALIAGTGLLWIRRGRGFVWLVLAALFGSTTAVVNSLPLGGFLFLICLAVIARARGWKIGEGWKPRLWQAGVLAAVIVVPVIAWGRYITATATVSNADVYGPYQLNGWTTVVAGAIQEVFSFHSPWTDWTMGMPANGTRVSIALRAAAGGVPPWITIVVVGALVLSIAGVIASRVVTMRHRAQASAEESLLLESAVSREFDAHRMLALGTMVTIILYPAALRVSNALNFGIDFGIVTRYSMAFAPLLVLLALLLIRRRSFAALMAALGVVGLVTTAGVWL